MARWVAALATLAGAATVLGLEGPVHDTSGLVGAEYTPWRASNQFWWHNYSAYRADVVRELRAMRQVLGFRAVRVFLHDLLWELDPDGLKQNMRDFLSLLQDEGMRAGFVFFDDCWRHSGAEATEFCTPMKGVHNGCWFASPQDDRRKAGVERFRSYVAGITATFARDPRVAWWEIFNEPARHSNFSFELRHAAFQWAKAEGPAAPVITCWDDNDDTDIVDHHQYYVPTYPSWRTNAVFSNPAKGGIVTEAGCRWYEHTYNDHGSPLTILKWLDGLRRNASGDAPFVPGVMMSWEVMVGNTMTRWYWGQPLGTPEPAVPWCGHLFPDGSPVSYTEAAATRRYMGAPDDFLFLETWLNESLEAGESVLRLAPTWSCELEQYLGCYDDHGRILPTPVSAGSGMSRRACAARCKDAGLPIAGVEDGDQCWCGQALPKSAKKIDESKCYKPCTGNGTETCGAPYIIEVFKAACVPAQEQKSLSWEGWSPKDPPAEALYELSVWPEASDGSLTVTAGAYNVTLEVRNSTPSGPQLLVTEAAPSGKPLGSAGVAGRVVTGGWNILRVLAERQRVRVWLNPSVADIVGSSVPSQAAQPRPAKSLVDAATPVADGLPGGLRAHATGGAWRIDYASVLPPKLFADMAATNSEVWV